VSFLNYTWRRLKWISGFQFGGAGGDNVRAAHGTTGLCSRANAGCLECEIEAGREIVDVVEKVEEPQERI
jgi:hypothetical protein